MAKTTAKKNPFLGDDYEVPSSGGKWTKLEQGETRIRFLTPVTLAWVDWKDKPDGGRESTKTPYNRDKKPSASSKHSWFAIIYNYNTKQIECMEISQKGIQEDILSLCRDKDFGDPREYDIKIDRKGSGRENTKYSVKAVPVKPVNSKIEAMLKDESPDLNKLFNGGNPFEQADVDEDGDDDDGAVETPFDEDGDDDDLPI